MRRRIELTWFVSIWIVFARLSSLRADFPPPEDRRLAEANAWIYEDFDAALKTAKESGKPILAVLRCPP